MQTLLFENIELPAIGLGTWHMGENPNTWQGEVAAIRAGLELGLKVIDTAEMYGEGLAESLVGEAITPFNRQELFLISKVYPWNASKHLLVKSLDKSLKRLKTDYLDMYLLHWPGTVPLLETVEALEAMKEAGKIRAWGVSNFDLPDLIELYQLPKGNHCGTNQVLYNLGSRGIEFDLQPWMKQQQLPLLAYSPIAQGDTLGDNFLNNSKLKEIAANHNASIFQILLAWTIRDGNTLAIPQSSKLMHIKENTESLKINLSKEDLAVLEEIYPAPKSKQRLAML